MALGLDRAVLSQSSARTDVPNDHGTDTPSRSFSATSSSAWSYDDDYDFCYALDDDCC